MLADEKEYEEVVSQVCGGLNWQPCMMELTVGIGHCTARLKKWYECNIRDLSNVIREKQRELKVATSNIVGGAWRGIR